MISTAFFADRPMMVIRPILKYTSLLKPRAPVPNTTPSTPSGTTRITANGATFADLKPYIELLTQGGASPDDAANDGATPIMLALQNQLFDVAAELLQSSKSPNQSDREGLNLVTRVFYNPYTRQFNLNMPAEARTFIELAVSKGVDPLQPVGDGGVNLVELAEKNGAIDLAIYLKNLKKGS